MSGTVSVVVLFHECGPGSHYDLMVEDPDAPAGQAWLWTWRIEYPPDQWRAHSPLQLVPLPAHRRDYLTYEGPLSDGRGQVTRVDQGQARVCQTSPGVKQLDIQLGSFTGRVRIEANPMQLNYLEVLP